MYSDTMMGKNRSNDIGGVAAANAIDNDLNSNASICCCFERINDPLSQVIVFEDVEIKVDGSGSCPNAKEQVIEVDASIVKYFFRCPVTGA